MQDPVSFVEKEIIKFVRVPVVGYVSVIGVVKTRKIAP